MDRIKQKSLVLLFYPVFERFAVGLRLLAGRAATDLVAASVASRVRLNNATALLCGTNRFGPT